MAANGFDDGALSSALSSDVHFTAFLGAGVFFFLGGTGVLGWHGWPPFA